MVRNNITIVRNTITMIRMNTIIGHYTIITHLKKSIAYANTIFLMLENT